MAKKKKRGNNGAAIETQLAPTSTEGATAAESGCSSSAGDIEIAHRAIKWLASSESHTQEELHESLLEAARPLILARASKYEEDLKAAKVAEASQGNPANARAGVPGSFNSSQNKKRPFEAAGAGHASNSVAPLSSEEVTEAARVLKDLGQKPEQLMSKACKPLRSALHPLVEAHLREEKASSAFRITCMLGQRTRWPEALGVLSEIRSDSSKAKPKLGAYQRWVREVGAAEGDPSELLVLDAIMRVAAGFSAPYGQQIPREGIIEHNDPWHPQLKPLANANEEQGGASSSSAPSSTEKDQGSTSVANRLLGMIQSRKGEMASKAATSFPPGSYFTLAHEAAANRLPPNRFDLSIFMCQPGVLPLNVPPERPTARHEVPGVTGAMNLTDVLSVSECDSLRAATEAMGYRPDVPLSSALDERAHNVVIMATEEQNNALFSRVRYLLPQKLQGDDLVGINRRWRIYRYQAGNLYRKHLDGAWPASGIKVDAKGNQEYVYDAYGGGTRSRFTFIVYLNDDFEGGCTTFFFPKEGKEGTLESRPIRPRIGSASVFPHGDTGIPLLHEGSSVTNGTKYLLRTDVVYARPETSEELKHAARLRGLARQLGQVGGDSLCEQQEEKEAQAGNTKKVLKSGLKKGRPGHEKKMGKADRGKKDKGQDAGAKKHPAKGAQEGGGYSKKFGKRGAQAKRSKGGKHR
eukprot:TRINITY_DN10301_c0_g1_i1.p1 TRINITY_DN10301_c0_g1~~TRINITY_DN10301_c0_g1_i1.p1  ORF type:complete len:703 (+),score=169.55 TRINITY_DN10301_c0_g1_i1:30-2111(+)